MIPEAAVEAAARGMSDAGRHDGGWDALPAFMKANYTLDARRALEAAAPHLFDEAAEVVNEKGDTDGHGVSLWLRAYGRQK